MRAAVDVPLTDAQRQLVGDNMGLAGKAADRFQRAYPTPARAVGDFEELVQIALVGIIRAAQLYDPAKARFSTYAVTCAFYSLCRAAKRTTLIAIPQQITGDERTALVERLSPVSLDVAIEIDREPEARPAEDLSDERAAFHRALSSLPARHRRILRLLSRGLSRAAIGRRMGYSRERIGQLEAEAVQLVRGLLESEGWALGPWQGARGRRGRRCSRNKRTELLC